jgi:hypothetical protein
VNKDSGVDGSFNPFKIISSTWGPCWRRRSKKLEGKGSFSVAGEIEVLEKEIDRMEKDLPPLKTFILPEAPSWRPACTSPEPCAAGPSARSWRCRRSKASRPTP